MSPVREGMEMKWEEIWRQTMVQEGIVGIEATEKATIPEGTLYKNTVCFGLGGVFNKGVTTSQALVFVPKKED